MLWRIHSEPVIALDGDAAGQRAALRVIDLALPLLEAGQGLRFVILPEGLDPDDLIRARGPEAMQRLLDEAQPMVRLLWARETDGKVFDSPERRAGLRKALRASVTRIKDPDIRRYYAETFRQFEDESFRPRNWVPEFRKSLPSAGGRARSGPASPTRTALAQTKATLLARASADRVVERMRETAILALLLRHPQVIAPFEGSLDHLEMIEEGHQTFLHVLLENHGHENDDALMDRICTAIGRGEVEKLLSSAHIAVLPAMKPLGNDALAIETLAEQLAKLNTERSLRREIEEAEGDMEGLVDEGLTWRLMKAADARNKAIRPDLDEMTEAGEDRAALSAMLQDLIDSQVWVKRKPHASARTLPSPVIRPHDSLEPPEDDSL